jgi:hypothetical protein
VPGVKCILRNLSCAGFDVVITLPNLQLAVDSQPYQLSLVWVMGSAPMVAYQGTGDSTQLPAVFGDSTFLRPMN